MDSTPAPSSSWTAMENKTFENALLRYSDEEGAPSRWHSIASELPGKTPRDVYVHYEKLVHDVLAIDSGAVDIPEYEEGGMKGGRREERRRGMPWTEEEHRRFLEGLAKYGKGDWRMISRMAVVTRTPTQVASHAQKYFLRQQSAGTREPKRKSIHDITH
ncbi:transcription factor DIVARICATA-like [Iris pallida]|uniref:Transcription factor MYBS1 n=1 Tax=Iris pallida TaxID=29817 RepID=A0AAX6E9P8_IRIPA|nr:transcription factor DIVARICATA-like [Iris pallida]